MRHEPGGHPASCSDMISSGHQVSKSRKKALKKLQADATRTGRDLSPRDNPTAPFQMCVLSELGLTTPHLDDRKPHENAAASEVTYEDLSALGAETDHGDA